MEDLKTTNETPKADKKSDPKPPTPPKAETPKTKEPTVPEWAKKLIADNQVLRDKVQMFEDMAGKNKIASWEEGQKSADVKRAYLKRHNGKLVIAWESLDYDAFNPDARRAEDENIMQTLVFEDGTKEKVNYITFSKSTDRVWVELITNNGDIAKVKFSDDKEMTIPTKFLNA